jgi:hypothetical protein
MTTIFRQQTIQKQFQTYDPSKPNSDPANRKAIIKLKSTDPKGDLDKDGLNNAIDANPFIRLRSNTSTNHTNHTPTTQRNRAEIQGNDETKILAAAVAAALKSGGVISEKENEAIEKIDSVFESVDIVISEDGKGASLVQTDGKNFKIGKPQRKK